MIGTIFIIAIILLIIAFLLNYWVISKNKQKAVDNTKQVLVGKVEKKEKEKEIMKLLKIRTKLKYNVELYKSDELTVDMLVNNLGDIINCIDELINED